MIWIHARNIKSLISFHARTCMWQGGKVKDSWRDKKAFLACKTLQSISNKIYYEASWESTFSSLDDHAEFHKNLMNAATGWVPPAIRLIWKGERNSFKDKQENMLYWKQEGCFQINRWERPHTPTVHLHTSQLTENCVFMQKEKSQITNNWRQLTACFCSSSYKRRQKKKVRRETG